MVLVYPLPHKQHGRRSLIHRPVRKIQGTLIKHRGIAYLLVVAVLVTQLYIQHAWFFGNDEIDVETPLTNSKGWENTPPCPSIIDLKSLNEALVCIEKCTPSSNNTLRSLKLDPNERVTISMPEKIINHVAEYGKYRVHFPEENVHLNLTGRLSDVTALKKANHYAAIVDKGYIHPRSITERLLRRIVARLLRAGVLDPSKNIVNTGSWIGDNALPWALMMKSLRPENPGKVVAIDPSEMFVQDMVDLANVNGIGNICAQVGILSSNKTRVVFTGTYGKTEHIKVENEQQFNSASPLKKSRTAVRGTWKDAFPLDSFNLRESVSLLHIDVEGHEGQLLEGARETIESSRPIIITEGYNIWDPNPEDENDKHVLKVMNEMQYTSASEIPEYCGVKKDARNRIWWPDNKTRVAAMAIVGKELERQELVPWIVSDLPHLH